MAGGDFAAAVKVYRTYVARNGGDVGAHVQLALALERSGQVGQGEATLRAVAKNPAARVVALRTLAGMLERNGKAHEAQQVRASIDRPAKKMRELKPSAH